MFTVFIIVLLFSLAIKYLKIKIKIVTNFYIKTIQNEAIYIFIKNKFYLIAIINENVLKKILVSKKKWKRRKNKLLLSIGKKF